ncbi:MAG: T9SS type A sorting domain-containing protein [Terrimonas sp.]|nr:T9SS type A sorting domain-containing protein [Terrimonas sp.]
MKAFVPLKVSALFIAALAVILLSFNTIQAQTSMLSSGLSFTNPVLVSGTDLQVGAVYRFSNVDLVTDATVRIDSLVNGATLQTLDDNGNGSGYKDAFQPSIKSGNAGMSYAVFTFQFYLTGTNVPTIISTLNATALDVDGSGSLYEFAKIKVGQGGLATYMSTTTSISISQPVPGEFFGIDMMGVDKAGIDTSAYENMFTATNTSISSFSINYGISQTSNGNATRKFSLYMKGFAIPNPATLPLELLSFGAMMKKNNVELNWVTLWEKNLSHFEIEKSLDGKEFKETGIVFGVGNSDFKTNYSYTDIINAETTGIIYYRLKLMDNDGKYGYSDIRVIRIGKQNESLNVSTYPNPVVNDVRITVPANWQGKEVSYQIYNMGGSMVKTVRNSNASQTEIINMNDLSRGFYVVKVQQGSEVAQQKIIKN